MLLTMTTKRKQQQQQHCVAELHCSMTGRHAPASLYAADEFPSHNYYTYTHTGADMYRDAQKHNYKRQTRCE